MSAEEFKKSFASITTINFPWGDLDAFGHVNNVQYFRYFETARINYLNDVLDYQSVLKNPQLAKWMPILAYADAKYRRPLHYPDTILVGASIEVMKENEFLMEYQIYSTEQDTITTIGHGRVVTVDPKTSSRVTIPNEFIQKILSAEEKANRYPRMETDNN
ncbi:MAG: thioesterase family protein [Pseudomonadota bacterium]